MPVGLARARAAGPPRRIAAAARSAASVAGRRRTLLLLALLAAAACRSSDVPTRDPAQEAQWVGAIHFDDVTDAAGIARASATYDAAVGDFDGDGWPDVYVGNHGNGAVLLHNQRDGTFRDVLNGSGIDPLGDQHGSGWADYDNDGNLDLYVAVGAGRGLATKANHLYAGAGDGRFVDRASESGTTDPNGRSRSVAWLDVDRDGRLDLVLANFASPNRLFLNRGDGVFEDASERFGLAGLSATRIAWADYDGDGFPDLLFSGTPHGMRLLRNESGARFSDVTRAAGLESIEAVQGMAFGDYDNDGDLDLALSHGVDFTEGIVDDQKGTLRFGFFAHDEAVGFDFATLDASGADVELFENGMPVAKERVRCGRGMAPGPRFVCSASAAAIPAEAEDAPRFLLWHDPDQDGNAAPGRQLWHLRWSGPGDHHLSGLIHGARDPVPVGLRTAVPRGASLWRNQGGVFTRALDTKSGGLPAEAAVNGQAVQWADVDADGWLDLYLVDSGSDGGSSHDVLLLNDAGRRFVAVPVTSGATPDSGAGRGVGAHFFDYDRDGKLDLFLTNGWGAPPFDRGPYRLLHNRGAGGHWLSVALRGRKSNRSGLGATIVVEACGERRMRYQNGGASYFSQSVTPVQFGLGSCDKVDTVEIRWPSGESQTVRDAEPDQQLRVEEEG